MSTATNDIVENRMTPVNKTEPVVTHHVTVAGFVEMLGHETGIDKPFQLMIAQGISDGIEWMKGVCKLAMERVADIPKLKAKEYGITSWQKERKRPELREVANQYQNMANRLQKYKLIYGACLVSPEFRAKLGITVAPDGRVNLDQTQPAQYRSISAAAEDAKLILGNREWSGIEKPDKEDSQRIKLERKIADEMQISPLRMTDEQKAALSKAVDDTIKAEQAKAALARHIKQVEAWTADILRFAGDKDTAVKFLDEIKAKILEPEKQEALM